MRVLLQRCNKAHVLVNQEIVGEIDEGLVIFVGVSKDDDEEDVSLLVDKLLNLRIFEDNQNKINLSLLDMKGQILSISQYSLYADYRKGRRPSFTYNAKLDDARKLYDLLNQKLSEYVRIETGIFQTDMQVSLTNNGPFTMMLDSKNLKK